MTGRKWAAVALYALAFLCVLVAVPFLLVGKPAPYSAFLLAPLLAYAGQKLWKSGEEEGPK